MHKDTRSGVERPERPGTTGGTTMVVPAIRPKSLGFLAKLRGGTTSDGFESVVTREETNETNVLARTHTVLLENGRSGRSTRSTDLNTLDLGGIQVERPKGTEVVPVVPPSQFWEVEALEVRFLGAMPVPFTITLALGGAPEPVYVSTSREHVQALRRAHEAVWAPVGFEYAAWAIQEQRADEADFARWCARLRTGWALGLAEACAGVPGLVDVWNAARSKAGVRTEPGITLGRMLWLVGARVVDVEVHDAESEQAGEAEPGPVRESRMVLLLAALASMCVTPRELPLEQRMREARS